ncbi:MAG: hypothetical protein ACTSQA_06855, partial [Candidatus Heimdallarchaeaceae archaeon]
MKLIKSILTAFLALLITCGVVYAANTFPTTLNSWSTGDTITADWANALEAKIGADSSSVASSLDYLIKNTSSKLGKIASLGITDGNFIVGDGTNWTAESGATARTSLGLGSMALLTNTGSTTIDTVGTLTTAGGNISLWTNDSGYATSGQLHNAITITGEDYLSLSTQEITMNAINPDNLANTDFGDFTCNGANCSLDTSYLPLTGGTISGALTVEGITSLATTTATGSLTVTGDITATSYSGDGSNLTGIGTAAASALTISCKAAEDITKG